MNSRSPFGFSHLHEGCRSEGSGHFCHTGTRGGIGKQQNCSAGIRDTFSCICCGVLRLRRLPDDFCFEAPGNAAFEAHQLSHQQQIHHLIKVVFQESLLLLSKWKHRMWLSFFLFFSFFLPTLSEARSCDPENEISTPLWKHCLRVTSQLSNRVVKSCTLERPRVCWFHFNHRCTGGCIHTAF